MLRFPDPIRRAFRRSSAMVAVAGLAVIASSITALATIGGSDSGPRPDREMTLSATEDETTTTTTMVFADLSAETEATPMPKSTSTSTTATPTVIADPVELAEKVNNHEERLGRLEETVATTTTTATTVAPPSDNASTTTTTVPARTRDTTTTTTVPQGEWVEVARFEGQNPPWQTPTLTTGYVRCVRSRSDGEADPEILQRRTVMETWSDKCVLSGPDGTVSPVFRLIGDKPLQVVNHTREDWVFGLIVEEYRCIVAGCAMPALG